MTEKELWHCNIRQSQELYLDQSISSELLDPISVTIVLLLRDAVSGIARQSLALYDGKFRGHKCLPY